MTGPMLSLAARDLRALKAVGLVLALLLSGVVVAKRADPDEVQFVLLPDAIPAITDPGFEETGRSTDRVLGVALNGEAKAYPIAILNYHEVVNDEIGGEPVVVTYCPLCATGVAYRRTMDADAAPDDGAKADGGDGGAGDPLTFKVSGRLYRNNLVMTDTRTGSLWSQAEGLGIAGKYEGYELDPVPSAVTTLAVWRRQHPNTTVLEPPGGRDYDSDPYRGYEASDDVLYPSGGAPGPLRPKAMVYGVERGGEAVAFPFETLAAERVVQDTVGGTDVVVAHYRGAVSTFEADGRTFAHEGGFTMVDGGGLRWNMVTGERMEGAGGGNGTNATGPETPANLTAVAGMPAFWFAWYGFHPDTRLHAQTVGAAPAGGQGLALLQPVNLIVLAVLAWSAFMVGRWVLHRWRRREGFAAEGWFAPRHGWVNAILVGVVASVLLYDASQSIVPLWRGLQAALGVGLLVWAGALAVEWRLHHGRVLKPTNLDPEGLWWDLEHGIEGDEKGGYGGDLLVHVDDDERDRPWWHPARATLEVVGTDAEIWVTRTGAVSVPADDDAVRDAVDAGLARWT